MTSADEHGRHERAEDAPAEPIAESVDGPIGGSPDPGDRPPTPAAHEAEETSDAPDTERDIESADEPAVEAGGVAEPEPLLIAAGLGLTVHRRQVFADVSLTVYPASLAAVVGLAGSGRSSLLLALTGRMVGTTGTLSVGGFTDPKQIRQITSVARITGFIESERRFTVEESIVERSLIDGVKVPIGRAAIREAMEVLGLDDPGAELVQDLPGADRTLLALALACARPTRLIVLDDLNLGLAVTDQADLLTRIEAFALTTGRSVVVSTEDPHPVPAGATTIDLATPKERV